MTYLDLRMFPTGEEKWEILSPSEFSQEPRVTQATSIFREKADQLICYFCDYWEKSCLPLDNWVLCQNPKSIAPWMIISPILNCSENSEWTEKEKQLELAL
jgi:hypothetical protein